MTAKENIVEMLGCAPILLFAFLAQPMGAVPAALAALITWLAFCALLGFLRTRRTARKAQKANDTPRGMDPVVILSSEVAGLREELTAMAPMLTEMHSAFLAAQRQRQHQQ